MVRIRRTADEWPIEVRGEAIGRADTAGEAEALAVFWRGRMDCVARWRLMDPRKGRICQNPHAPAGNAR